MSPLHLAAYVCTRGSRIDCRLAPKGSVLTGSHRGYKKKGTLVHRLDISNGLDLFKTLTVLQIWRVANTSQQTWRTANDTCSLRAKFRER